MTHTTKTYRDAQTYVYIHCSPTGLAEWQTLQIGSPAQFKGGCKKCKKGVLPTAVEKQQ